MLAFKMAGVVEATTEMSSEKQKDREIHQYTRSEISLSRTPRAYLEPLDVTIGNKNEDGCKEIEIRTPSGYSRKTYLICTYAFSDFQRKVFKNFSDDMETIKSLSIRPDDTLLVTFPKSGTNWAAEILKMIRAGTANYAEDTKVNEWIDTKDIDHIDALKSPRILNTHANVQDIPNGIIENRCKVVIVLRNPKDVCVSLYNQLVGFKDLDGTWEDFVYIFSESEYGTFHNWFTYTRNAMSFAKSHDFVYTLYFEDLKENTHKHISYQNDSQPKETCTSKKPSEEIQKLARFLEVDLSDQTVSDIADKCSFSNLKEARKVQRARLAQHFPNYDMYRKGTVGDWKNWFTVAQSERFDAVYKEKMQGCDIDFKFTI